MQEVFPAGRQLVAFILIKRSFVFEDFQFERHLVIGHDRFVFAGLEQGVLFLEPVQFFLNVRVLAFRFVQGHFDFLVFAQLDFGYGIVLALVDGALVTIELLHVEGGHVDRRRIQFFQDFLEGISDQRPGRVVGHGVAQMLGHQVQGRLALAKARQFQTGTSLLVGRLVGFVDLFGSVLDDDLDGSVAFVLCFIFHEPESVRDGANA